MVVRLTLGIQGIIHFFLCASAVKNGSAVDNCHSRDNSFFLCASEVKNGSAVDTRHSRDNSFFSLCLCGKKWWCG